MKKSLLLSKVIQWGGPAIMFGGALWSIRGFISKDSPFLWYTDWRIDPFLCVVLLLWLMGLSGYAYHRNSAVNRAGFNVFFIGAGLMMFNPAAPFGLLAGLIVIGIMCVKRKDLGGWSIMPCVTGLLGLCSYIPFLILFLYEPDLTTNLKNELQLTAFVFALLFGLGWISLGYALWSCKGRLLNAAVT